MPIDRECSTSHINRMTWRIDQGRFVGAACIAVLAVAPSLCLAAPEDGTIRLTRADCRYVLRHRPSADVEYKPGVDIYGRAVAPADVDGGVDYGAERFTLNLTFDIFEAYGIAPPIEGAEGNVGIGTLQFEGNRVWFNGKRLNDQEADGLVVLCRDHYPSLR